METMCTEGETHNAEVPGRKKTGGGDFLPDGSGHYSREKR